MIHVHLRRLMFWWVIRNFIFQDLIMWLPRWVHVAMIQTDMNARKYDNRGLATYSIIMSTIWCCCFGIEKSNMEIVFPFTDSYLSLYTNRFFLTGYIGLNSTAVTPQWHNSYGLRVGKPAGTRAEGAPAGCPFTQAFQLILLFHKGAPFQHFPIVCAKFSWWCIP